MTKVYDSNNYLYFTQDLVNGELTDREVRFLVEILQLNKKSDVLDLPCGYGRHSNRLAAFVGSVTGLDASEDYIAAAMRDAKERGVEVTYLVGDMRNLTFGPKFDAVIVLFTSFGMFSHSENLEVLKGIATSLRPGGKFCIEIMNPAPLSASFKKCFVFEKGNDLMIDRLSYDPDTNRFVSNRIYIKDGQRMDGLLSYEIFSLEQMEVMMKPMGLGIRQIFPTTTGGVFTKDSPKMVLIGEKE
jgi:SAM-dependent methyltransferase